ncbi:MFS transporter [Pedobacter yulinensis]|nr:MFS transporter [Pedobacter yulinensis]
MNIYPNRTLALLVLLAAHLLTIVDIFIVNIAIPSVQQGLTGSDGEMQLVVAMYMVGFASCLIAAGRAGDHYGRKKIFLAGMSMFMLSSAGCGLAGTPGQLILLRFVQGCSAGLMSPQVLAFIHLLFPGHGERTHAIGWYGMTIGIGTMSGQFLGGLLVELHPLWVDQSWRYIFLVNIPVCLGALMLGKRYLPAVEDRMTEKMDYTGALLVSAALILLVFSLTAGMEQPVYLVYTLPLSLLLFCRFGWLQRHRRRQGRHMLVNPGLFAYWNFNLAILAAALFMFMLDAYFFVLAIFLQTGLHLPPLKAGFFVVFQGAGFMLASLIAPRLVLRFGKAVLISGVLFIALALALQLLLFTWPANPPAGYAVMVLHGFGVALVLPSFANIAMKGLPTELVGNASGVYTTAQQLFGALGISLTGGLFYHLMNLQQQSCKFLHAFAWSTLVHLVCLGGVLVALLVLPGMVLPKISGKTAP